MADANSTITIGQRFVRWTVTSERFSHKRSPSVQCRCDCGAERTVRIEKLQTGKTRSCGCLRDEELTTHGQTANDVRQQSSEYWIWNSMIQRTTNPKNRQFHDYGGRGIDVCERWRTYENFFADMGKRPSADHSLEREKNWLGYSPENCTWATRNEQNRNKRNNRFLTAAGKTQCVTDWAREMGCNHATLLARLRAGWSDERTVTTPVRRAQ